MLPTEKLYFMDSGLLEFQAQVVAVASGGSGDKVLLDRTAFYPTGGGQPNDVGTLNDVKIVDVIEEEDGRIIHVTDQAGLLSIGDLVDGKVDSSRRLDHLQQHSGQHILSQAFIRACGAQTQSFHLGAVSSTIDIEMPAPSAEAMRAAEDVANAIIFEDRSMRVHLFDEKDAASMPLRKESAVSGTVRVIEVEDFDWSPCGGTHASRTGQIGLIVIKSFERVKGNLARVEFVCGNRALNDYRLANQTAVATARLFSAEREAAPELAAKALQENRALKKRIKDLLDLAMTAEAVQLLQAAPRAGDVTLVKAVFEDRDPDELRLLAAKITQQASAIALLAGREENSARVIFARSASLPQNMGELLGEACQLLGGRGGGKPEMAQGGVRDVSRLHEALDAVAAKLFS